MRLALALLPITLAAASGCAPTRVLLQAPPSAEINQPTSPLRITATVHEAPDPLPIEGENVRFEGVADTLGMTLARAAMPWAQAHLAKRPGGWELRVDLEEARAQLNEGHRSVELAATITLETTRGRVYLAQTHGYCKQSELAATLPEHVVYGCMESMARDVAGWLDGISP